MNTDIDLEAGQVAQATAPRAGAFSHSLLIAIHSVRSVNVSQRRDGKSRDARNGYFWASHEQCGKLAAVGSYCHWPRY